MSSQPDHGRPVVPRTPPAAGPDPEQLEQGHQVEQLCGPSLTMASLLSVLRVTTASPTGGTPKP